MIQKYEEFFNINEGNFKNSLVVSLIAMSLLNSCRIFKHHKEKEKTVNASDNRHWVNSAYGRHYDGEEDGDYIFMVDPEGKDGSWIRKIEYEKYKKKGTPVKQVHKQLPQHVDKALSTEFSKCSGKLPWPVDNGTISDKFGIHTDKKNAKVKMERKGVFISTKPNSPVKPVFSGTVSKIFDVCGETTIIVTHGTYYTVYSGFKYLSKDIKVGHKVNPKEVLGVSKDTVDFQVWNNKNGKVISLDPEQFLIK